MDDHKKECCPMFEVERWDGKEHIWDAKPFIRESIPSFFHMPYPPMIAKTIQKMCDMANESEKMEKDMKNALVLFTDPNPFRSEIYLSVTGPVDGAFNTELSGRFQSKVFDGPYNAIPKFMKEMDEYLAKKDMKAKKYYVHYAYCPGCAKKYGHNYMIFFAAA